MPEKIINLRCTEREANELMFLFDVALKNQGYGGLKVMPMVSKFMARISDEMSSGIVAANASDLPPNPVRG